MTSKNVLNKILALLSSDEVLEFTDAKAANGDILQSPTFDLNESVEVVHEDGTKTPAPDGEYEISLKDESGNENIIRIQVKDGKIAERENVEEKKNEEMEKPKEEVVDKEVDEKKEADVKMADATTEEAHPLPQTTDEDPRNQIADDSEETEKDPLISLSYRIDELEKAMKTMMEKMGAETTPVDEETPAEDTALPEGEEVAMSEEEEELPKLDGAPIETGFKFGAESVHKPAYGKKVGDSQSNFLSKLYN